MFTIIYLSSILILMLFSWVGNTYGLLLPDGTITPNLLSSEGIRWLVRHSIDNIAKAPIVEVTLILIIIGALHKSGLWDSIIHRKSREIHRSRHALRIALVLFATCAITILAGIIPGGNLLSVTGHIAGGPLAEGWLFLLTLSIGIPCVIYGRMNSRWDKAADFFAGLTSEISSCASYFITLIAASQLIAITEYIHLFELLRMSPIMQSITVTSVYAIPLILQSVTNHLTYNESPT